MTGFLEAASSRLDAFLSGRKVDLTSVEEQTDDDRKLAAFVKGKVDEVRTGAARVAQEGIWMTNIAYLLGYDSIHYDTNLRKFMPVGGLFNFLPKDRVHVNRILPKAQNRLARLLKNPPRYDVRPNSNEQDDKDAASLSMRIIMHYWDQENINDKRIDVKMWCQQTGVGYFHVCWDGTKGKYIRNPETGELDFAGDIRVDVCSPFEIFPDPEAKRFDECRYLTRCKVRPLSYFKDQYPDRGHLVKEEGVWLNSLAYDNRINSMSNEGATSNASEKQSKNSAIEMSYYEAPCRKYPRGRHIVSANGVLLKNGPLPASGVSTEQAMIPFAKFDDIRIGGKYYSECVITHARPLQDQLNRTYRQRAEWVNKVVKGKYIAARGHNIASDAMNDQSGEMVEYDPVPNAPEPHALQTPTIPQALYLEEERLDEKIDDGFGINEVSSGQLPSSGMPAIGMQFLVEQDDTRIGVVTEADEYAYARLGKLILRFAQAYVSTERCFKFADKNQEYVVKKFKGSDIKGNDDVIVIRGSTLPGSKVLKRQEILTMYTQGLLGDPNDPRVREKVLALLEYGDVGEAWLDLALDMHQIKKGISEIENGTKPIVDEQDNHSLWVQELNRYRKGDKFAKLSEESQLILLEVREEHLQMQINLMHPEAGDDSDIPPESNQAALAAEAGPVDANIETDMGMEMGGEVGNPMPMPEEMAV